jgi:alanine racemase
MSIAIPAEDPRHLPSRAVVDTAAITHNTRVLVDSLQEQTALMAVVKADGYGHGMLAAARAAQAGGATWLGVAHPASALALARAGLDMSIFTWLYEPHTAREVLPAVIREGVDVSVGSEQMLQLVSEAARQVDRRARIHVKIDTGMGRNGVLPSSVRRIGALAQADDFVSVVGSWTHLSSADELDDPMLDEQVERFDRACEDLAEETGPIALQHLANSAATLRRPDLHRDIVRPGISLYGYAPVPTDLDLRPALTVTSRLALVKDVPAEQPVGYGHIYTTERSTRLGLVPIGYADGLHRAASGKVELLVRTEAGDELAAQVGRISMDQTVLDLGAGSRAREGDEVIVFGSTEAVRLDDQDGADEAEDADGAGQDPADGADGAGDDVAAVTDVYPDEPEGPAAPTADDWARAADTIPYEILTAISARVPREVRS